VDDEDEQRRVVTQDKGNDAFINGKDSGIGN